jgi:hypothetical protein
MKKLLKRTCIIILFLLPVMAFAHFLVFPQETRCILISFSEFEKRGNVYFNSNLSSNKIDSLITLKNIAEKKALGFWGNNFLLNYKFIYCNNEKEYNKYGQGNGTPACAYCKMGAYVVVSIDGLDSSIIAHELSHCILYNNIGFYNVNLKIPTWFNEGLAMQIDERDYYSIDSLMAKKEAGIKLPDVKAFKNNAQFLSGNHAEVMLNYATAKYTVSEWMKTHSLSLFIKKMNDGDEFNVAYEESLKQ